jgi:L-aspartate oxidase
LADGSAIGMTHSKIHDVLIIGSGAAGLGAALALPADYDVAIVSKGRLSQGATNRAQGGIATVLADDDSFDLHEEDTIVAGAGLCHRDTVRFVVERAPAVIEELERYGIQLTKEEVDGAQQYHLGREGGHSRRRIVHAADATGRAVQTCLQDELARRNNIAVYENRIAVDLITNGAGGEQRCIGVQTVGIDGAEPSPLFGRVVILATGGASKVYLHATNPEGATGDGIAMAWRAGCRVANMEFTQFHPTCLHHPGSTPFLITEAMRGEGARLVLPDGTRFMPSYHPLAELAPRDVVSRAIHHEMTVHGLDCVYLDIRHKPAEFVREHFPTIYAHCLTLGIDITRDRIPVVPAAHYTCGGIVTDLAAHTDIAGLYAIGECAFTGLHGANRMASNSLLECLVFAHAAAEHIVARLDRTKRFDLPASEQGSVGAFTEPALIQEWANTIRRLMWRYAGIVRTIEGLDQARRELEPLADAVERAMATSRPVPGLIELRNLACVADLIIRSALSRHESRGLHYILDYPEPAATPVDTVLGRPLEIGLDSATG